MLDQPSPMHDSYNYRCAQGFEEEKARIRRGMWTFLLFKGLWRDVKERVSQAGMSGGSAIISVWSRRPSVVQLQPWGPCPALHTCIASGGKRIKSLFMHRLFPTSPNFLLIARTGGCVHEGGGEEVFCAASTMRVFTCVANGSKTQPSLAALAWQWRHLRPREVRRVHLCCGPLGRGCWGPGSASPGVHWFTGSYLPPHRYPQVSDPLPPARDLPLAPCSMQPPLPTVDGSLYSSDFQPSFAALLFVLSLRHSTRELLGTGKGRTTPFQSILVVYPHMLLWGLAYVLVDSYCIVSVTVTGSVPLGMSWMTALYWNSDDYMHAYRESERWMCTYVERERERKVYICREKETRDRQGKEKRDRQIDKYTEWMSECMWVLVCICVTVSICTLNLKKLRTLNITIMRKSKNDNVIHWCKTAGDVIR